MWEIEAGLWSAGMSQVLKKCESCPLVLFPLFLGSIYLLPVGLDCTEPGYSDLSVYTSSSWVTLHMDCNGSGIPSPSIDGGEVMWTWL